MSDEENTQITNPNSEENNTNTNDSTNDDRDGILILKDEILKYAPKAKHNWDMNSSDDYGKANSQKFGHVVLDAQVSTTSEDANVNGHTVSSFGLYQKFDEIEKRKADKSHASDTPDYGTASDTEYGHVKVDNEFNNSSENPVQNKIITNKINNLDDRTKALENCTIDIDKKIDLRHPRKETNIDTSTAGFYIINDEEYRTIDKEVYYHNALLFVLKQDERVIQSIYPTEKIITQEDTKYELNGSQYNRFFDGKKWGEWQIAYKPRTKNENLITQINDNDADIKIIEDTNGYQIKWTQDNENKEYEVKTNNLYEYETICEFDDLSIDGPFIFSNLIGKCDIRITSEKMEVRSTLNKGNLIKNIEQTFFVPRK